MSEQDFILKTYSKKLIEGYFSASAPSNIALVKYWGKKEEQIPMNASISLTLEQCRTNTTIDFSRKEKASDFSFDVYLDGKLKEEFKPKIVSFFKRIEKYVPFIK